MKAKTLARVERIVRPFLTQMSPSFVVSTYSKGRLDFLKKLEKEIPAEEMYIPSEHLSKELWGIKFRSPIMNAAGMFKNGECYEMVAVQGAGAYLGGTGTINPRKGNSKDSVDLPFVPYPKSNAASNWLGLPNNGDWENHYMTSKGRILSTPVGWSVMGSPDHEGQEKLKGLVESMKLYNLGGVDFLEINESCPNTSHGKPQDDDIVNRLRYIKENFLDLRKRRLPVIVKFSNDTEIAQIPELLDLLFEFGYDGVNFGNTSTDYKKRRRMIHPEERKLFDYFSKTFGGGVSGAPLRDSSLELATAAVEYMRDGPPTYEFHVIRTGGIETLQDIAESENAGISLNQWFTGYFDGFSRHGHDVYRNLFKDLD